MTDEWKKVVPVVAMAGAMAALAGSTAPPTRPPPGGSGGVSFRVQAIFNSTGAPDPGARISFAGQTLTADGSGVVQFSFSSQPAPGTLSASDAAGNSASVPNFAPVDRGSYSIALIAPNQVIYSQTVTFISGSGSASGASVTWRNNDQIPVSVVAAVTVKNASNQTVALGKTTQQIAASRTQPFSIQLLSSLPGSPVTLPPGSYIFEFSAFDTTGRPISEGGSTPITVTVGGASGPAFTGSGAASGVAQPGPGNVGYTAALQLAQATSSSTGSPTLVATSTDLAKLRTEYPGLLYLNSGDTYQGSVLWAAYYVALGNKFDAGMWAWLASYNPSIPQTLRGS